MFEWCLWMDWYCARGLVNDGAVFLRINHLGVWGGRSILFSNIISYLDVLFECVSVEHRIIKRTRFNQAGGLKESEKTYGKQKLTLAKLQAMTRKKSDGPAENPVALKLRASILLSGK